ncbi:MAG: hypothetical protein JWQ38_11 [Flavipsychrobacter sp.]|nr:hypothetical protein [Flavipsychrobacter sp.]
MLDHRFFSLRVTLIAIIIAALAQSGCRENTLINSKVVPNNNTIGVYDTSLDCITHTYYDDTVITSLNIGGIPIYQGVGAIIDPFFGGMTGSTFFQVVPNSFNSALYDGATIDSVIFVLPYSGYSYGDTATHVTQSYQVMYMQDAIAYDQNYYSFTTKAVNEGTPLSDPTTVDLARLNDTFSIKGVYYTKGLRIKLNKDAFMADLKPGQDVLTTSSSPATDFIAKFPGLCLRVSNPLQYNTLFPYFRLDGDNMYEEAGVLVYYHRAVTDTFPPENYSFNTTYCAHFNNISRNYSSYPVNALYHSTLPNDSVIALENQPGAAIDVMVPGIKSLPAGIINKAELQFTLLPSHTSSAFDGPEKIYPLGIANGIYPVSVTAGVAYNVSDRYPLTSLTPLVVMDGYVHTMTRNGQTVQVYTIDLPRELMGSIAAKNDTMHLHINGTQDFYGAFHMVAGGGSHPEAIYRPKLFVVYSKLN